MADCCHEAPKQDSKRLRINKSLLACLVLGVLILASYLSPGFEPFRHSVLSYFRHIWWAVLLGFFLGGLIERYIPREYISLVLAQKKKRTILSSVLLGFTMSACSHGILALSMELHKKGASTPVVVSFLLASPWANLPITLMLIAFFGLKAIYIILSALLVAFITGLVFQFLDRKGLIEPNPYTVTTQKDFSIPRDIQRRFTGYKFSLRSLGSDARVILRGAFSLADMTLGWIIFGILLSSLAAVLIPHDLFHRFMGPSIQGLLATLGLATLMEVCSEGTAPLAFEIFKQTGAFGNVLVFLMAGVATDLTEIGLVWSNMGRKTALWLPVVAVPQIVVLGYVANRLFG